MSAKLYDLENEIDRCQKAGISSFHLDVMDGHFVPNLTIGPEFVKAVKHCSRVPLETHLMIDRPDKYYEAFANAGSDVLMIHYESPVDIKSLFRKLEKEDMKYSIVVNPDTNFERVKDLVPGCYSVLIMSVYPGFSGQKFIPDSPEKLREARDFIDKNSPETLLEIDGGINLETGKLCVDAGADVLISGSYIFKNDLEATVKGLQDLKRS